MEDIRNALEIELDRLRSLVAKYRPRLNPEIERIREGPINRPNICLCANHLTDSTECPFASNIKRYFERYPQNCVHYGSCSSNYRVTPNLYFSQNSPSGPQRFEHKLNGLYYDSDERRNYTTLTNTKEIVELAERRRFTEAFLRLHEFYRKHYPIDSELVTELRALRATYEQTGGGNAALKAALDKTLDEALKVEAERRLGLADLDWYERNSIYHRRWDHYIPYHEREYRWERKTHLNEIERANNESQLIGDQLRRLRTKQEDRTHQQPEPSEPTEAQTT